MSTYGSTSDATLVEKAPTRPPRVVHALALVAAFCLGSAATLAAGRATRGAAYLCADPIDAFCDPPCGASETCTPNTDPNAMSGICVDSNQAQEEADKFCDDCRAAMGSTCSTEDVTDGGAPPPDPALVPTPRPTPNAVPTLDLWCRSWGWCDDD